MTKNEIVIKKILLLIEENIKKIEETNWEISSKVEKEKLIFATRLLINQTNRVKI